MPKRNDLKSILIIGAGPIVIGQACEFDYSGVQACKAIREEGYRVILLNSNPATIMTDPDIADATYIEPITSEVIENIIIAEKPDAILPTVGGQTALNAVLDLHHIGILEKYSVELIGANIDAINKAEDRALFNQAMKNIGLAVPKNAVVSSLKEAFDELENINLPAIIRPSFTLGGTGGGVAYNREEFKNIVKTGLEASPVSQVQIDQSLLGWKEYEMEVIRDKADNAIIICSIENVDPMGVHTGDSITVAPALTLTDKEYQIMRNASIAVLKEIGVETGGSNVQFAINPDDGKLIVIEMNPRVSRSSALASKATGYPIAKVAAKLAIGYSLDEIDNDCTKGIPASFEPTIDYIVTKIPRFTFEKFQGTDNTLSSSMKSVGEVMAIGRNFKDSIHKALRSLDIGLSGFDNVISNKLLDSNNYNDHLARLISNPTPERFLYIAECFRNDISFERIKFLTKFDDWFLHQIAEIVAIEKLVEKHGYDKLSNDKQFLLNLKKQGFSDKRIAFLVNRNESDITKLRSEQNILPVYKRVDTCAGEFNALTPYMYSCYENSIENIDNCEIMPTDNQKIFIIGGGPNRIGQGLEFDYCCVQAAYSLKEAGYETIMVNCNPETVSTDYDTADRLYFEPLTDEDVINLINKEMAKGELKGVILQFGGQTPLKLAGAIEEAGIKIIGTSVNSINLAEDRDLFKKLLDENNLKQPENRIANTISEVENHVDAIGFPVVVRPSYVLGGRAMEIIYDFDSLAKYLQNNANIFDYGPLLIDSFLTNAIEVDIDVLSDGKDVFIAGIMEHIEEAGIHSGDSACSLPPYSLSQNIIDQLTKQATKLSLALNVIGLMNIQFAVQNDVIYIIEANPRASRTVPFVSKTTGINIAHIAARIMAGESLASFNLKNKKNDYVAVKEAVFPFIKFPDVDVLLGPEMKSTGEVMGIDSNFAMAFAKAQLASGNNIPTKGTVFISVKDSDKESVCMIASELQTIGFKVIATFGTAKYLYDKGIRVNIVNKVLEGRPHIVDLMIDGSIDLVINTTAGTRAITDSFTIRRTALMNKISYCTTISSAEAVTKAIKYFNNHPELSVTPIQKYLEKTA
ncbi:MAG: carbamoyl-phosphate synthase large subunit [Pseudomonadota bacterium]